MILLYFSRIRTRLIKNEMNIFQGYSVKTDIANRIEQYMIPIFLTNKVLACFFYVLKIFTFKHGIHQDL